MSLHELSFRMRNIHLATGFALFFFFTYTGALLADGRIAHNSELSRAFYRANHIYLFFISLLHFMLFLMNKDYVSKFGRTMYILAVITLYVSTAMLVTGFYLEPATASFRRPITGYGVIILLPMIILLLLAETAEQWQKHKAAG